MLHCGDGTFYTGITTDLVRRLREHNGEVAGGARYTRVRRPVTLHYSEQAEGRGAAARREAALRRLTHVQKKDLGRRPRRQRASRA